MPCGRCRQLLWEHGGPECLVEAAPAPLRMAELLPHAFDVDGPGRASPGAAGCPRCRPRLAEWRGRGTVFVHPDLSGGQQVWTATGSGPPVTTTDAETGVLEEGPTWADPADAIAWGQARTPRVVVVDADGAMFWAGEGDPPAEIPGALGGA